MGTMSQLFLVDLASEISREARDECHASGYFVSDQSLTARLTGIPSG
jgi:hypothetical protein